MRKSEARIMAHDLSNLFSTLASLYEREGRDGANEAVTALKKATTSDHSFSEVDETPFLEEFETAFATNPAPEAIAVQDVLPLIKWHYAGLEDGRIRPEIARHMLTAELLGPDGMIFHPTVRVGLFMQRAGLNYVTRNHAAEECFIMLAGEGFWSTDDGERYHKTAGNVIFHPSMMPHRSETREKPLLAAWRWSGDIGWDQYQLKG
jgi:gentisate 1,2-dioxygenase